MSNVNQLIPIIRTPSLTQRSFSLNSSFGIAIYEAELVLFTLVDGLILPEEAYHRCGGNFLEKAEACEKAIRIPLAEVVKIVVHYSIFGSEKREIHANGKKLQFSIPTDEAFQVDRVLEELYGSKFEIKGRRPPNPEPIKPASVSSGWSIFGLRKAGQKPFYSERLALVFKILCIPVALVAGYSANLLLLKLWPDPDNGLYFTLVAMSGFFAGYGCLSVAYRLGFPPGQRVLKGDQRAPVIYLRSFQDDGQNNLNPVSSVATLMGLRNLRKGHADGYPMLFPVLKMAVLLASFVGKFWHFMRGERVRTSEEQLGSYFGKWGPFVAIGKPGENLTEGGASRLYVDHNSWQKTVNELLVKAQLVILQPKETDGVWWEIKQVIRTVDPAKILICLVNYTENQFLYDSFRQKFERETSVELPRAIGRATFLYFRNGWQPRLLELRYHSEFRWPFLGQAVDFAKTFSPYFEGNEQVPFSAQDRRFRGHGCLALFVYFILTTLILIGGVIAYMEITGSIKGRHHQDVIAAENEISESIARDSEIIRRDPTAEEAYLDRAEAYEAQHSYREALADYLRVIDIGGSQAARGDNGAAWIMSTAPIAEVRNGTKAVEYANEACSAYGYSDPNCLDTLAAAYAEVGSFEKAIDFERRAISHIDNKTGINAEQRQKLLDYLQKHLELYMKHVPCRYEY